MRAIQDMLSPSDMSMNSRSHVFDDASSADFTKSLLHQKQGKVRPAKLSYITDDASVDMPKHQLDE